MWKKRIEFSYHIEWPHVEQAYLSHRAEIVFCFTGSLIDNPGLVKEYPRQPPNVTEILELQYSVDKYEKIFHSLIGKWIIARGERRRLDWLEWLGYVYRFNVNVSSESKIRIKYMERFSDALVKFKKMEGKNICIDTGYLYDLNETQITRMPSELRARIASSDADINPLDQYVSYVTRPYVYDHRFFQTKEELRSESSKRALCKIGLSKLAEYEKMLVAHHLFIASFSRYLPAVVQARLRRESSLGFPWKCYLINSKIKINSFQYTRGQPLSDNFIRTLVAEQKIEFLEINMDSKMNTPLSNAENLPSLINQLIFLKELYFINEFYLPPEIMQEIIKKLDLHLLFFRELTIDQSQAETLLQLVKSAPQIHNIEFHEVKIDSIMHEKIKHALHCNIPNKLKEANALYFPKDDILPDPKQAFKLYSEILPEFKEEYGEAQYMLALIINQHSSFTPDDFKREAEDDKNNRIDAVLPYLDASVKAGYELAPQTMSANLELRYPNLPNTQARREQWHADEEKHLQYQIICEEDKEILHNQQICEENKVLLLKRLDAISDSFIRLNRQFFNSGMRDRASQLDLAASRLRAYGDDILDLDEILDFSYEQQPSIRTVLNQYGRGTDKPPQLKDLESMVIHLNARRPGNQPLVAQNVDDSSLAQSKPSFMGRIKESMTNHPFIWSALKWLVLGAAAAVVLYFTGGLTAIPHIAPLVAKIGTLVVIAAAPIVGFAMALVWRSMIKPVGRVFFGSREVLVTQEQLKYEQENTSSSLTESVSLEKFPQSPRLISQVSASYPASPASLPKEKALIPPPITGSPSRNGMYSPRCAQGENQYGVVSPPSTGVSLR